MVSRNGAVKGGRGSPGKVERVEGPLGGYEGVWVRGLGGVDGAGRHWVYGGYTVVNVQAPGVSSPPLLIPRSWWQCGAAGLIVIARTCAGLIGCAGCGLIAATNPPPPLSSLLSNSPPPYNLTLHLPSSPYYLTLHLPSPPYYLTSTFLSNSPGPDPYIEHKNARCQPRTPHQTSEGSPFPNYLLMTYSSNKLTQLLYQ